GRQLCTVHKSKIELIAAANPATVLALLDELEAKDKRITELEAKLETADKLQDSSFRHGLQHGFSLGQTDNQAGFEQAIHAYGQQWKGE
ncbi:ead/Ea22-like family protein, partial [Enterobacter hormaechei]|uniref:ead/Ea22-like family protein n=1 Tax=Enterobacter hormaechei TaxID=158836 RepID=UPI001D07668E